MKEKMTFNELVEKIADKTGASTDLIHDMLLESVFLAKDSLNESGEATLKGLGKFSLRWHEAKQGRNPQTGEILEIPAQNSIVYKPDSDLRKFINRKYAHLKLKILKGKGSALDEEDILIEEDEDLQDDVNEVEETLVTDEESEKKSFNWLWFIIPLLLIIIAFLVWPKGDGADEKLTKAPESTEMAEMQSESEVASVKETVMNTEEAAEAAESEPVRHPGIASATYTIVTNDKLWTLARNHYNQGNLWPNIYRVNKSVVQDPDVLIVGSMIDVPALEGTPGQLSDQDKQDIANGFLDVYNVYRKKGKYEAFHYLWVARELGGSDILKSTDIPEKDLIRIQKMKGMMQIK